MGEGRREVTGQRGGEREGGASRGRGGGWRRAKGKGAVRRLQVAAAEILPPLEEAFLHL